MLPAILCAAPMALDVIFAGTNHAAARLVLCQLAMRSRRVPDAVVALDVSSHFISRNQPLLATCAITPVIGRVSSSCLGKQSRENTHAPSLLRFNSIFPRSAHHETSSPISA